MNIYNEMIKVIKRKIEVVVRVAILVVVGVLMMQIKYFLSILYGLGTEW